MAYSNDLRLAVFQAVDKNIEISKVSGIFGVSRAIIYVWLAKRKEGKGQYTPFSRKGMYYKADIDKLKEFFRLNPDAYDKEAVDIVGVNAKQIQHLRKQLKISIKKNKHFIENPVKN